MDDGTATEIRSLISTGVDWGCLLDLSRLHHMLPLLYRNLEAHCWETVPNPVQEQLRSHFSASTRRNLILTGELFRLLRLFEAHGIPAVPFRGPTLAALVYGDLALRQFGDLDILVHKPNVLRAKDLLLSCGYRPIFPLPAREEAIFGRCEYGFVLDTCKVFIDLHWETSRAYVAGSAGSEPLWQRLEHLSLEGRAISTLSKADLFIHLCMHGAKHHWERLDWICDVTELIRSGKGIDWGWIMEQSRTAGSKRMTCLGMFLAWALLGVDVPEQARREVQADNRTSRLAEQVCQRLFRNANSRNSPFEEIGFYLRTMDRTRDRIRYCLDRLVNPPPWSVGSLHLPAPLYFLHYLLRPLQLAKRYGFR